MLNDSKFTDKENGFIVIMQGISRLREFTNSRLREFNITRIQGLEIMKIQEIEITRIQEF